MTAQQGLPPSGLSAQLGPLPPQREGQASLMTITAQEVGRDIELGTDEVGHWFSPDAVRERVDAAVAAERERCKPNGLMFDALGEPRTRYVRVSLSGNHCVMHPSEGDTYLNDALDSGDSSPYVVADVWLSEREFDDLPEHDGF